MSAETNTSAQRVISLSDQRLAHIPTDVVGGDVSLEDAPDADGCGAMGCRRSENLIQATISGFGQRTLCLSHLKDLLEREVTG